MTPLETGMGGWAVAGWTALLIVLSAFFVAAEFALMAAKQHRLEERAGSAAGRAALRNSAELTLVLAGSQLGITVCTLALGAITKPAVHHALTPLLAAWGIPLAVADVASFVLALVFVTFLHLVVGEMAPKSWAIAHPDVVRSALVVAVGATATADQIGTQTAQIQAITADPDWRAGRYLNEGTVPRKGLAVARMAAHITYLSEPALQRKFGRELQVPRLMRRRGFGFENDCDHEGLSVVMV